MSVRKPLSEKEKEQKRAKRAAMTLEQREAEKKYMREWNSKHREERKAKKAQYYVEHKDHLKQKMIERHENNRDVDLERMRLYYQGHKEEFAVYGKQRHEKNKHEDNRRRRERYDANWGKENQRNREYWKRYYERKREELNHSDKVVNDRIARRARKFNAEGSHTVEGLKSKYAEYNNRCVYCGSSGKLVEDHVIPLARGGKDSIDNIYPSCSKCNGRKGKKTYVEYMHILLRRGKVYERMMEYA